MHPPSLLRLLLLAPTTLTTAMLYYPNAQISQLEHLLVDNWGAGASNFSSAITPCDRYVTEVGDAALNSGRTTSAQWLRVAFHDFATADVGAGTGGIDASIGFETFRDENKGSAFNDSFTFWRPFVNEFVPMADLVALGTVMSVNLCGNKYVPFRPGRVDAVAADPKTGVPEPGTSLEDTLNQFAQAGLNQSEAIILTACGHTLGSSHHSGFPEVADNSTVSANNTNGGIDFDGTRGVFDAAVVRDYVDGAGSRGGPLVTSFNESSRSDLRLYESDGNTTMRALRARGDAGFLDACADLLARMLDTVPAGVVLGDVIRPMSVKPVNVSWDIITGGGEGEGERESVVLSGVIRILNEPAQEQVNPSITITFSNGYTETLQPSSKKGTSVFGTTLFAPFTIPFTSINQSTSFTVTTTTTATTTTFPIPNPAAFIIPSQTTLNPTTASIDITIAARDSINTSAEQSTPRVTVTIPVAQPLTLGPRMAVVETQLEEISGGAGPEGFVLWRGSIPINTDITTTPTGAVSVRLVRGGDETVDVFLLGAGVAGW